MELCPTVCAWFEFLSCPSSCAVRWQSPIGRVFVKQQRHEGPSLSHQVG